MGPSGAGKTTLINVLAGQLPAQKNLTLQGQFLVNKQHVAPGQIRQAYVQQNDVFFSMLTTRETLVMAAELRLKDQSGADREKIVDEVGFVDSRDAKAT